MNSPMYRGRHAPYPNPAQHTSQKRHHHHQQQQQQQQQHLNNYVQQTPMYNVGNTGPIQVHLNCQVIQF